MTAKTSSHYYKKGLDYYLNDPENGIWFYSDEEQRDKDAVEAIRGYCDPVDGWNEDVADISVGVVTGSAAPVNVVTPIGKIDEEGYDENLEYWDSEFACKCSYAIKSVATIEITHCIERLKWFFPKSYVYKDNELIVEPKNNIYFRVDDIETEFDFKRKIIEYLSRPSCKGVSPWWQARIRNGLNGYLGTSFTQAEMMQIYSKLGGGISSSRAVKFIESDYDFEVLS